MQCPGSQQEPEGALMDIIFIYFIYLLYLFIIFIYCIYLLYLFIVWQEDGTAGLDGRRSFLIPNNSAQKLRTSF